MIAARFDVVKANSKAGFFVTLNDPVDGEGA